MPPIATYYSVRQSDSVHRVAGILKTRYTSITNTDAKEATEATGLLVKKQIQVTTTITPTLGGGAANTLQPVPTLTQGAGPEAVPPATHSAASPLAAPVATTAAGTAQPNSNTRPTTSAKDDKDGGSVFGVNLSWWQITGIALACVTVACLVVYLVVKRRTRQQKADQKSKEAQAEEGRKAREEAARLREEAIPARMMGMGMGMGLGGGLGGGIGGYPVVLNQGAQGATGGKAEKRDRGRRKDRRRYSDSDDSWESSGTESYDDLSDGGTIRKRRRRKPRRRKEKRRGRKHRNGRYSDDEDDIPSSASSSFYARPEKERHRPVMRRRDATLEQQPRRVEAISTREEERLPMGLGPPTGSARTPRTGSSGRTGGSSGRTPRTGNSGPGSGSGSGSHPSSGFPPGSGSRTATSERKEAKSKNWRDSVFSTYDSMRRAAVRHKYMDGKVRLQKQLEEEEKIERHRQEKIREANEQLQREKDREAEMIMELENEKLEREKKQREQRSVLQIANLFTKRQDSQSTTRSIDQDAGTPIRIPMPQPKPSYRNESTRSNLQSRQRTLDSQYSPVQTRMLPPQRQFSSPASAYNSALPEKQHRPRLAKRSSSELPYDAYDGVASVLSSAAPPAKPKPASFGKYTPLNRVARRQDSDPPLKSAMRAPGVRRPERKATINNQTSTIRPKPTTFQSDTTQGSVTNDFLSDWLARPPSSVGQNTNPYQSAIDSANESRTGSVFLPVPLPQDRPRIKRGGLAPAPPPRAKTKSSNSRMTESSSHSGGSRSGRDNENQVSGGQGLGGGRGVGDWQSGISNGSSDNQANKRWANRLRERR